MQSVNPERNEKSGQYEASYTDADFVETLDELGGEATSSEVADQIGCVRDSAYRRLNQLAENGVVTKRRAGRTILWQLSGDEREH
jgi:predicted transcriptional regulator